MAPKVIGKGPNGENITEVDHTDPKNYVVERIMGTRLHEGSRQFLIRYEDYPTLEWIEDAGLIHCTKALSDFKKTMGYPARGKGKYPGFPLDDKEHMVPPDNQKGNASNNQPSKAKRIVIGKGPNGESIVRYEGELDDNDQFQVERVMGVRDVGEPPAREFLLKLKDKSDLEWIGEDNLVGCEDLVVRFKMEIGVQHLQHELDKPILVPADKPRPSHTQAQSTPPAQERRFSAPQKQATSAAKQKPGGSGLQRKTLATMTAIYHPLRKKTAEEDDREPHLQLPEDMPSSSRKRGAAQSPPSGGTDDALTPKSAVDRHTVPAKKMARVEVDDDENVEFEHKEPPASPASVEPPPSSPDQEPHEELLKKIEATHDLSKSDKERMKAIIDYVVETRFLEADERKELKGRMEKVLILGVSPHLVVGEEIENITPDVVKTYEDTCRGANRIIKEDFPKLRDEFVKETRDGKGVVDALVTGQWFERVAAYYFRKLREVRFPVTGAAVEAVGWQLVAPVCPQQRSKMNDEAREFFAATLKKKALAAKIITD